MYTWPPLSHQDVQDAVAARALATRDLADVSTPVTALTAVDPMVSLGTAGAFDAGFIESPSVFYDPAAGRLAMVYTGYTLGSTNPSTVASIGLAYSDDGLTWTKSGQMFAASGTTSAPDQFGVTGAVVVFDSGVYHLFYIGLTAVGYEGGTKTICHATATSLSGSWTRLGTIIGPSGTGWRQTAVWHPNLVYTNGQWYLFFNATGSSTKERVGYATAATLAGPWAVADADAPLLPETGHTTDNTWGGDPFVWREGDHWRMDFASADSSWVPQGDWWATTTDALFPLGWTLRGQVTSGAAQPYKPWVIRLGGRIIHYGTMDGTRIAAVISPDPAAQVAQTVAGRWRFNPTNSDSFSPSMIVGDDIAANTGSGRAKLVVGGTSRNAELLVGQDSSHMLLFSWQYNSTAASATAALETYGGSNLINIQNNTGAVRLGGSGGSVGFYGTSPAAKQTVTGSKGANAALTSLLSRLAALGLITDTTT